MATAFTDIVKNGIPEDALPEHRIYENPLVKRYATKEMSFIFSPAMKFSTWRELWTALVR